ncbi:fusion protein, partial [Plasmodium cynomolgi strain B]
MRSIFPLSLLCITLSNIPTGHAKVCIPVPSYITHNSSNAKYAVARRKKRMRARWKKRVWARKKKTIIFEDVVTQKDISTINLIVLALMEFQKQHNSLVVPENYVLKSQENEDLKSFKLWKKLQDIKNEKSQKKKKYIYFVLKKMNFPVASIFSEQQCGYDHVDAITWMRSRPAEMQDFEKDDAEITTMSNLSTEENVHYDFDERQEVRKELFSLYVRKAKDKGGEDVKDFLASYKFIPKISEQNVLPTYSNKATRKKGILQQVLENLKQDQTFSSNYNYYYDNIYNNLNDKDVDDYISFVMKYKRTHGAEYDFFVNGRPSLSNELNPKEKKFILYTRKETEGAHAYDFDKWSFADFVEALVYFNDLYLDLNRERYERFKTEQDQGQKKLDLVDFNFVDPSFVVPMRMGDIDCKFHFIRRKILDYLLFDFKPEEFDQKYVNFTWRKLYLGLAWFIHTRGHPIVITPMDRIQFDTFPMDFCKPEEIQGLRLGFLIIQAQAHEKIFWNNYQDRFDFMKGLEINIRSADELIF